MAIQGTLPVVPTPFVDDRVDYESIERMLDYTLPHVDGYTLMGSTSEAPSMTMEERLETTEFFLGAIPAGKTKIVGVGHTSVQDTIRLARHAQEHGADGVLVPVPYYFPNTMDGALSYLSAVDQVLDIEMVLYDNPVTTKTTLSAQAVIEWTQHLRNAQTVKLTDHNISKIKPWKEAGLNVLAGDDVILVQYLTAGVDGSMVLAPMIFPAAFKEAWELIQQGEIDRSFEIFTDEILPFLHIFGIGDEIATTKSLYCDLGLFTSSHVRPPLTGVDPIRRHLLRLAYDLSTQRAGRN